MKPIYLSFLALPLLSRAQEPNPFEQPTSSPIVTRVEESRPKSPTRPFLLLTEHIIAPATLVDRWYAENPGVEGGDGLRAIAGRWIEDGAAVIEQAAFSEGVAEKPVVNESVREQVYATRFKTPAKSEWAFPEAFETINCGYDFAGTMLAGGASPVFEAAPFFCRMLSKSQIIPDPVSQKTHQPGDVFVPNFQLIKVTRMELPQQPQANTADPFGGTDPFPLEVAPRFAPGQAHLVNRSNESIPEPIVSVVPFLEGFAPDETGDGDSEEKVRLIFFRGEEVSKEQPVPAVKDNFQVAVRVLEVDTAYFARYLGDPLRELGPKLMEPSKDARPRVVATLAGTGWVGANDRLSDVREFIYPTEWQRRGTPEKRLPPTPKSFEKRNTGIELEFRMEEHDVLTFSIERAIFGDFSVHHRSLIDGKWEPDILFPIFSANVWKSSVAVRRGKWMLVGTGSAFGEKGGFDHTRIVLAFLKVS